LNSLPEIIVTPPGPRSREICERLARVESPAVAARRDARNQAAIAYARGEGSNVWDADGNRYVDLTAGFGALVLGHKTHVDTGLVLALGDVHPSIDKALLCEKLAKIFPEPNARVILGLSGADAVTAALKTAMLATKRARVVAFEGAYHGLSYAPLAACGLSRAFREPFAAQLGDHVTFAPYGSVPDLDGAGAVLVEPILGRGGCIEPPKNFLADLRRACDAHGALLIADEIWTGLGRSGAWLASAEIVPDIVCIGKALGGGLPVSACVGRGQIMGFWADRGAIHTATHFGWPLACRAALATLAEIESGDLCARARRVGEALAKKIGARGRGLMLGVPMKDAAHAQRAARRLLERGYIVLTGGADGSTITLTPPLNIDEALLDAFGGALAECT